MRGTVDAADERWWHQHFGNTHLMYSWVLLSPLLLPTDASLFSVIYEIIVKFRWRLPEIRKNVAVLRICSGVEYRLIRNDNTNPTTTARCHSGKIQIYIISLFGFIESHRKPIFMYSWFVVAAAAHEFYGSYETNTSCCIIYLIRSSIPFCVVVIVVVCGNF